MYLTSFLALRSNEFLIYNADLDKCVTVEGSVVTGRSCDLSSSGKVWRWTPFGQIQNIFSLKCLSAPDKPRNWARVELIACNRENLTQIWTCADKLFRPNGLILNLNFGNVQGGDYVVLFQGTGPWSKWQVFGEQKNICSKQQGVI